MLNIDTFQRPSCRELLRDAGLRELDRELGLAMLSPRRQLQMRSPKCTDSVTFSRIRKHMSIGVENTEKDHSVRQVCFNGSQKTECGSPSGFNQIVSVNQKNPTEKMKIINFLSTESDHSAQDRVIIPSSYRNSKRIWHAGRCVRKVKKRGGEERVWIGSPQNGSFGWNGRVGENRIGSQESLINIYYKKNKKSQTRAEESHSGLSKSVPRHRRIRVRPSTGFGSALDLTANGLGSKSHRSNYEKAEKRCKQQNENRNNGNCAKLTTAAKTVYLKDLTPTNKNNKNIFYDEMNGVSKNEKGRRKVLRRNDSKIIYGKKNKREFQLTDHIYHNDHTRRGPERTKRVVTVKSAKNSILKSRNFGKVDPVRLKTMNSSRNISPKVVSKKKIILNRIVFDKGRNVKRDYSQRISRIGSEIKSSYLKFRPRRQNKRERIQTDHARFEYSGQPSSFKSSCRLNQRNPRKLRLPQRTLEKMLNATVHFRSKFG